LLIIQRPLDPTQERRRKKKLQMRIRKYHILWYLPRRTRPPSGEIPSYFQETGNNYAFWGSFATNVTLLEIFERYVDKEK